MEWARFRDSLGRYARLQHQRRSQLLFRGHGSIKWPLLATLDRHHSFSSDDERRDFVSRLQDEFAREALLVQSINRPFIAGDALELLARHHGLWSRLLDWTTSPYIASFFAYQASDGPENLRVWVLDRAQIPDDFLKSNAVSLIDDRNLLQ